MEKEQNIIQMEILNMMVNMLMINLLENKKINILNLKIIKKFIKNKLL